MRQRQGEHPKLGSLERRVHPDKILRMDCIRVESLSYGFALEKEISQMTDETDKVTADRTAPEDLHVSEIRYRRLFESARAGLVLFAVVKSAGEPYGINGISVIDSAES